jgi:3-oxoadipate enol-lactonase
VPTVDANGITIYYERGGSGPPLLFCNGSGATVASTRPIRAPFRAQFDLAVHDQRGLGRTTVADGPYTMADYAADAMAVVDALGWDTCRLVGLSFGGMVAQEVAVMWPERVERLALLCTSPGGTGGASYPLHELAAAPVEQRTEQRLTLLDTRFTPEWFANPAHRVDRAVRDQLLRRAAVARSDAQLRGEAAQLEARSHHDVTDRLGRITCPTLVASGEFDGIAPAANGKAIADRVPDAELRTYAGGHLFFYQDPRAYPEIVDFLARS